MERGWISLHRGITEHWIWSDAEKLKWWLDILLSVNHKEQKILIGSKLIKCDRGQSIYSLLNWSKRWGVSKDTVRNFLKLLAKDKMIKVENINVSTRITVLNYDSYQTNLHGEQTESKQTTIGGQTDFDPNNKANNGDNLNKEIPTNVGTKKDDEARLAELTRKKEEQKRKLDAAKAATLKRKELFREELSPYIVRYGDAMISQFFNYWTEMNRTETKMKFELQKTWDLALRLGTWHNREPINRQRDLFSKPLSAATTPDNRPRDREGNLLQ